MDRLDRIRETRRQVKRKSNEKCLHFLLHHRLAEDAVTILSMLGRSFTQSEIAEKTGFSKQKVNYWVKTFLEHQLIKEHIEGTPKYYRLTPIGQKKLMGSDDSQRLCILEDFPMKFRLVRDFGRVDWEKLGSPRNWVKLGVRIGDVTVVKTSQNVIIHTGQLSGSADQVLMEAGEIRSSVRAILESNGVVLEPFPEPLHKPKFKFYIKEAEFLHSHFGNISVGEVDLDNSPPPKEFPESIQRLPHIEGDREFAINFISQANRIAEMERRQIVLQGLIEELRDNERRLIAVIERLQSNLDFLLNGNGGGSVGAAKGKQSEDSGGGMSYIS